MVFPNGGFTWIRNDYLRNPKVSSNEKIIYQIIASHANDKTDIASINIENIHRETGISDKTIIKMLKQLEHRGLFKITKTQRHDRGTGKNIYQIINTFDLPTAKIKVEVRM